MAPVPPRSPHDGIEPPKRRLTRRMFTEEELQERLDAMMAERINKERAEAVEKQLIALHQGIDSLNDNFREFLVEHGRVLQHLSDAEPIGLPSWSVEQKRALLPIVREWLEDRARNLRYQSSWRQRAVIGGFAVAAATLLLTAAATIYNAFHGVSNPIGH